MMTQGRGLKDLFLGGGIQKWEKMCADQKKDIAGMGVENICHQDSLSRAMEDPPAQNSLIKSLRNFIRLPPTPPSRRNLRGAESEEKKSPYGLFNIMAMRRIGEVV